MLKAQGIRVDTIVSIIEDLAHEPWRRFAGETGVEIGARNVARPGDEVWILFGLDVPVVLSRPSARDPYYIIIGHAMLWERGEPSSILFGGHRELHKRRNDLPGVEVSIM